MSKKNLALVCTPFDLADVEPSAEVTLPRILTSGFFNPAYLKPAPESPRTRTPNNSRLRRSSDGASVAHVAHRLT